MDHYTRLYMHDIYMHDEAADTTQVIASSVTKFCRYIALFNINQLLYMCLCIMYMTDNHSASLKHTLSLIQYSHCYSYNLLPHNVVSTVTGGLIYTEGMQAYCH